MLPQLQVLHGGWCGSRGFCDGLYEAPKSNSESRVSISYISTYVSSTMSGCHDAPSTPWWALWWHMDAPPTRPRHFDPYTISKDFDAISLHELAHGEPCALQALVFNMVDHDGVTLMPCHCVHPQFNSSHYEEEGSP